MWLEATDSFYKKLNRTAKECELSRYEALSRDRIFATGSTGAELSPEQKHQESWTIGGVSANHGTSISELLGDTQPGREAQTGQKECASPVDAWRRPPLGGSLVFSCRLGSIALVAIAGTIENADGVGLELDSDLLDRMLDRFLAARDMDGSIVFARAEFALHEHQSALQQA